MPVRLEPVVPQSSTLPLSHCAHLRSCPVDKIFCLIHGRSNFGWSNPHPHLWGNIDRSIIILYARIYTANQIQMCANLPYHTWKHLTPRSASSDKLHKYTSSLWYYCKNCVKRPFKILKNKDLNENDSLMKIKSIALEHSATLLTCIKR